MSFCERGGDSDVASSTEDLRPGTPGAPCNEEAYVWTLSEELKEIALKDLGETEQVFGFFPFFSAFYGTSFFFLLSS